VTPADLAMSLRTSGETVSLGGLEGLLALAGVRVTSLHRTRHGWTAVVEREGRRADGGAATLALALAEACDALTNFRHTP